MDDVKQLLADIEHDIKDHALDIRLLELLLVHARRYDSRAECGVEWHKAWGDDLAITKASLGRIQKEMHSMLIEWYVGAALSVKEKEMKHD